MSDTDEFEFEDTTNPIVGPYPRRRVGQFVHSSSSSNHDRPSSHVSTSSDPTFPPDTFSENSTSTISSSETIEETSRSSQRSETTLHTLSIPSSPQNLGDENSSLQSSQEIHNVDHPHPINMQEEQQQDNQLEARPPHSADEASRDAPERRSVTPEGRPAKIQKLNSPVKDDEQDGETCTICLDAWGNSGEHRLVALKCGHLFGQECVVRWLKGQPAKDRCCPTCKTKSALKDIRCIYARKLVAADTSEMSALKEQFDKLQAERNRTELELQKSLLTQKMYLKQINSLQNQLKQLEHANKYLKPSKKEVEKNWRFALEKNLEIARDNTCRVLTYNCRRYELFISQKSTNSLFQGFGVRKVNCIDYKPGQFIFLHPKAIRDLSYSQPNDLLLSVGLDKTAKLFSGRSNQITHNINSEIPLWSCTWDFLVPYKFFIGGPGGFVHQYDIRNTERPVHNLQAQNDVSPVISLASTEDGLISCQLNSCNFYSLNNSVSQNILISNSGPFLSVSYDCDFKQLLLSARPNLDNPNSRHTLYAASDGDFNKLHEFQGSSIQTLMSRSCLVRIGNAGFVAAHHERDQVVSLYSTSNFEQTQVLSSSDSIIDINCQSYNGDTYLATLSQSKVRIYKAVCAL